MASAVVEESLARDVGRAARHTALNMAASIAGGVLTLGMFVVVTRQRGPAGAGAFFMTTAIFTILCNVSELGADTGLLRSIPHHLVARDRDRLVRTFRVALIPPAIVAIVAGAAVALAARPIGQLVASPAEQGDVASMLRAAATFMPFAVLASVLLAATRGFGTMAPTVRLDRLLRPAAQFAAVGALAGRGGAALGFAFGLPYALAALLAGVDVRRLVASCGLPHESHVHLTDGALVAEFWRFSLPRALSATAQIAIDKIDVVLVGALASTAAAGVYGAATRYVVAGMIAATAVMQAMQPVLTTLLARRDLGGAARVAKAATAWTVLVAWPLYGSLALLAAEGLRLFGRGFAGGAAALVIVSVAMMFGTGAGPTDVTLLMAGGSRTALLNTLAALAVNVGLNLALIPHFGITGAAVAWAASIIVTNVAAVVQVRGMLGFHPFSGAWVRAATTVIACLGVGFAATLVTNAHSLARLVVFGAVSMPLYVIAVWVQRDAFQLTSRPPTQEPA